MLYIMRHGITDWNVLYKLQGQTDIPLNADGRALAAAAREEYASVHFDVCFCSPLRRAKETAEILLEGRGVPILPDDRLKEMCFGIYEGAVHVRDDLGSPAHILFSAPETYTEPFEGAETYAQLFERTGRFLEETALPLVSAGKDVLIVGHAGMNSSIICRLKNIPLADFWTCNIDKCRLIRLL